jgi:hypothetical protein
LLADLFGRDRVRVAIGDDHLVPWLHSDLATRESKRSGC